MSWNSRLIAVALLAGSVALLVWAPDQVFDVLHNFLALGNLAIFILAALVLAWFCMRLSCAESCAPAVLPMPECGA